VEAVDRLRLPQAVPAALDPPCARDRFHRAGCRDRRDLLALGHRAPAL